MKGFRAYWQRIVASCLVLVCGQVWAAEQLCAEVKIEILQEFSLERQGFEASMQITNSLDTFSLEDIAVQVAFTNAAGEAVLASSDPNAENVAFFIKVDDSQGLQNMQIASNGEVSDGEINPKEVGIIRWLIIPATQSAGQIQQGTLYYVGATLNYSYGGKQETVTVAPDSIIVKPLPDIQLDYFLTQEVIGDDAFTNEIEAPEPYTLGLRVTNTGYGIANNVAVESAQPKIVANEQGLAINFNILKSFLGNQNASPSLLINFGDIDKQQVKVGRWIMQTSLSGTFEEITASFTHADELGGALTSLLSEPTSHLMIKDVLVDLAGRDKVRDFLAPDQADKLYVFESERTLNTGPYCDDCLAVNRVAASLSALQANQQSLRFATQEGLVYSQVVDPYSGEKVLASVVRSDGKNIDAVNAWLSKSRNADGKTFDYFINLFDSHSTGIYTLNFNDSVDSPQAPVMQVISDRSTFETGQLGFIIQATDANGTIPNIAVDRLPSGASFTDKGNGSAVFNWQPLVGQAGHYTLTFSASDDDLSSTMPVNISVYPSNDKDGDGLDDEWELLHFGDLEQNADGDYDADGRTNLEEFEQQTDPTSAELAPGKPQIEQPIYDADVVPVDPVQLFPSLSVTNAPHGVEEPVQYIFEIYADESLTELVASSVVMEGAEQTQWLVTSDDLNQVQQFSDNTLYYWRARAQLFEQNAVMSEWVNSRFFINLLNDYPSIPQISQPQQDAVVAQLQPYLEVSNATDIDRDNVIYGFDVFSNLNPDSAIYSISGLIAGENGVTRWQLPSELSEDNTYLWQAWAEDEHGARTAGELSTFLVSVENNAPSIPTLAAPANGQQVASFNPSLLVDNAVDPEHQLLSYYFELDTVDTFDSPGLLQSPAISENASGQTAWAVSDLIENQDYYWRVKAFDGVVVSAWQAGQFFVNTKNDAPSLPGVINPGADAVVETLQPLLELSPSVDPDSSDLEYHFELYNDSALTDLLASSRGLARQWKLDFELDDNRDYFWRYKVSDGLGLNTAWSSALRFTVNENGLNDAPTLSFVLPEQAVVLNSPEVLIQWIDADPDSSATIDLYYSESNGGLVLIAADISEDLDAEHDQYLWNASALAPGTYHLSAEIHDEDTVVKVDACCDITVPFQERGITVTPLTELVTSESATALVELAVSLDSALQEGTSLSLNYSVSDNSEAKIYGANSLYFTADNWFEPQSIWLKGLDDCEVDGDQSYTLMFQTVATNDEHYQGLLPQAVNLINQDNEQVGQSLFVCDYQLISKTAVANTALSDYVFRPRLLNLGLPLTHVAATVGIAASTIPNSEIELLGEANFSFERLVTGVAVASDNTLTLRFPSTDLLDFGRLEWSLMPGDELVLLDGDELANTLKGSDGDDVLDGKAGNDNVYGGLGDDTLLGGAGNDLLDGGAGNDTLVGGTGADSLYGQEGDDTIVIEGDDSFADKVDGGEGFDQVVGGSGDDTFRFSSITNIEKIDGLAGTNRVLGTSASDILDFSYVELVNIARIDGLAGNDIIYGSSLDDVIKGNEGNDRLYGNAGDDIFEVVGNEQGADTVNGGAGNDRVLGSSGDDVFRFYDYGGADSVEYIEGLGGTNIIEGDDSRNILDFSTTELSNIKAIYGLAGNDVITGGNADDVIYAGDGNDILFGGPGDDSFIVSPSDTGFDRYYGGEGYDKIIASNFDDTIRIAYFSDDSVVEEIDGGGGINQIVAYDIQGGNTLDFTNTKLVGISLIDAGAGNDVIYGSSAADTISGGSGMDYLHGAAGDDIFLISPEEDNFDHYNGGSGIDTILGSDGDDVFRLAGISELEVIDGGQGYNIILGNPSSYRILDFSTVTLKSISLISGNVKSETIYGSQAADVIRGGLGADRLYGEAGDDIFELTKDDTGEDLYSGGDGFDIIKGSDDDLVIALKSFSGSYTVERIDAGKGVNIIVGNDGFNSFDFRHTELIGVSHIDAGGAHDEIWGSTSNDVIYGGDGGDYLHGEAGDDVFVHRSTDTGFDIVSGGSGFDSLLASDDDDVIGLAKFYGDYSLELIDGRSGNNIILGSEGNNVFDFSDTELTNISLIDVAEGDDSVRGSQSDDVIVGGFGKDDLYGEAGDDVFLLTPGDEEPNVYDGGEGFDTILGGDEDNKIIFDAFYNNGVEAINAGEGYNFIEGTDGNNHMDFSSVEINGVAFIDAKGGDDIIFGSSSNDVILGGLGNDYLYGHNGDDRFELTPNDSGINSYNGGEGIDTLIGTYQDDIILINNFSNENRVEVVNGGDGINKIVGTTGNNVFDFRGVDLIAIHRIDALSGNDEIWGSASNDSIKGGIGNDVLYASAGADTYYFERGDGQDSLSVQGGDQIVFENGVAIEDLWFVIEGDRLLIYLLASTDIIEVQGVVSGLDFISIDGEDNITVDHLLELAEVMTQIATPVDGLVVLNAEQQSMVAESRLNAWQ